MAIGKSDPPQIRSALDHAAVRWRPLISEQLMVARGLHPFGGPPSSMQYMPQYRSEDAARSARFYNIPYREPDWPKIDWKRVNMAAVAAGRLGDVAAFSRNLFAVCFGAGAMSLNDFDLSRIARDVGLNGEKLVKLIDDRETEAMHRRTIDEAVAAQAFGVPSFVADGEVFWGNDRIILLRHHLGQDAA